MLTLAASIVRSVAVEHSLLIAAWRMSCVSDDAVTPVRHPIV